MRQRPKMSIALACVFLAQVADPFCRSGHADSADESRRPSVTFAKVRPILVAHCLGCHGLEKREAKLDLRTLELVMKGGQSGPVIQPGAPEKSLLLKHVLDRSMPPERQLPLTDEAIDTIRNWVEDIHKSPLPEHGEPETVDALDREHWSFRQLQRPRVPESNRLSPIDRFLFARLSDKGLSFAPPAENRTLIRRLSFDLTGLPPSIDDLGSFESNHDELAYERLVDRLLASPHFGERWGRHWLDAGGYVDTIGDDTDAAIAKVAKGKWKYRDYVIRSLNADKRFDAFLMEQIAGDELVDWKAPEQWTPAMRERLVATTFLRSAADETLQNELNTADIRHEVLARTMEVTLSNLLGLTIQCARCHTHKYDPIPQADYYRLLACFSPAFDPQSWLQPADRELADLSPREKARREAINAKNNKEIGKARTRIKVLFKPVREALSKKKYDAIPTAIREDLRKAIAKPAADRAEVEKYLAERLGAAVQVSDAEIVQALPEVEREAVVELRARIAELQSQRQSWGTIQAVYDTSRPPTYLLKRGDHHTPGNEVRPGWFQVLSAGLEDSFLEPASLEHSSGRRLALARRLTDTDRPAAALLARVFVNRVWSRLFGRGIVESTDNFGYSGALPTHPDLLEWLAAEFIETHDWSVKALIRSIVLTEAYRQSSLGAASNTDPGNELLGRARLRQLESEVVRDAILAIGGRFDRFIGGPPLMTQSRPDGSVVLTDSQPTPSSKWRRSLYLLQRRRYHPSFLEAFGQPELATNCTERQPVAVVAQSLAMLNDAFLFEQSQSFADRVLALESSHGDDVVALAWKLALSRTPTDDERAIVSELIESQTERYRKSGQPADKAARAAVRHLCHMLLCSNEFLYVE